MGGAGCVGAGYPLLVYVIDELVLFCLYDIRRSRHACNIIASALNRFVGARLF